jgi:large subunit ribosomal protein L10
MPKSKEQKNEQIKRIQEKLESSKGVVFSTDQGLKVKEVDVLRNELRQNNAEYLVAKKTLLRKATANVLAEGDLDNLSGSVGVAFSYGDEVTAAKILNKFAKDHKAMTLSGGILENKYIVTEMVNRLAALPSREQLLSKLVGTLNSPMTGFVNVLSGNTRKLVYALNAIKEKKSQI